MGCYRDIFLLLGFVLATVLSEDREYYYKAKPKEVYVEYKTPGRKEARNDKIELAYKKINPEYEKPDREFKKVEYEYKKSGPQYKKTVYEYKDSEYANREPQYTTRYVQEKPADETYEYKKYVDDINPIERKRILVQEKVEEEEYGADHRNVGIKYKQYGSDHEETEPGYKIVKEVVHDTPEDDGYITENKKLIDSNEDERTKKDVVVNVLWAKRLN